MRLTHINLVARDANELASFYISVCKCHYLHDPKELSGEKVSRGNGLPNSKIYSIWLGLPNCPNLFLEIHQHAETHERPVPRVNEPGFGHLAFQTEDLNAAISAVLAAGGAKLGEITTFGSKRNPTCIIYMRDPEGNILELEQPAR